MVQSQVEGHEMPNPGYWLKPVYRFILGAPSPILGALPGSLYGSALRKRYVEQVFGMAEASSNVRSYERKIAAYSTTASSSLFPVVWRLVTRAMAPRASRYINKVYFSCMVCITKPAAERLFLLTAKCAAQAKNL